MELSSILRYTFRFDLNKLNIDYGSVGNSPWYSTPSPEPHEAFAEPPPSPPSSSSSPTSSFASTTSSPWDRLQEMEEPLPHNFKENAFSNLAVRWRFDQSLKVFGTRWGTCHICKF